MPRVRYLGGGGYYMRAGPDFDEADDEAVVNDETADRLCDRPDFERVKTTQQNGDGDGDVLVSDESDGGDDDAEDGAEEDGGSAPGDGGGYLRDEPPAVQIDEGACPWCPPDERYEGDAVGQHAASAHPDEWAEHKANRED